MTRTELLDRLHALAEPDYRAFSQKLLPHTENILGVRLPLLHALAKEIIRKDPAAFLFVPCGKYFEEQMVRGFVIARMKLPAEEKCSLIRKFLPLIDNWSVCDSFCAALKDAGTEQPVYLPLIEECLTSKDCFTVRFGLVMLTDWYLTDRFIDLSLERFFSFTHPDYYAKMAAAWGISAAFVRYPDKTAGYLRTGGLDPFTHNTAIRKICESRQVSKEQKEYVKTLRL